VQVQTGVVRGREVVCDMFIPYHFYPVATLAKPTTIISHSHAILTWRRNQIKIMNTPAKGPCLSIIASRALSQPIHSHLMAFCPTMDLLAVVTHEERVEVHRLNGQRAFGLQRKSQSIKVESLCWKYNGTGLNFLYFSLST
jgi:hypothetical protein